LILIDSYRRLIERRRQSAQRPAKVRPHPATHAAAG
jgi:hypothetical protein